MKVAQVIWSEEALNDLETIYDFLSEQSESAAQKIADGILSRARQLENFPMSGAIINPAISNFLEYRYLVEGHYKIVYRYDSQNQTIIVVTIFDTRYDPEKLKL